MLVISRFSSTETLSQEHLRVASKITLEAGQCPLIRSYAYMRTGVQAVTSLTLMSLPDMTLDPFLVFVVELK